MAQGNLCALNLCSIALGSCYCIGVADLIEHSIKLRQLHGLCPALCSADSYSCNRTGAAGNSDIHRSGPDAVKVKTIVPVNRNFHILSSCFSCLCYRCGSVGCNIHIGPNLAAFCEGVGNLSLTIQLIGDQSPCIGHLNLSRQRMIENVCGQALAVCCCSSHDNHNCNGIAVHISCYRRVLTLTDITNCIAKGGTPNLVFANLFSNILEQRSCFLLVCIASIVHRMAQGNQPSLLSNGCIHIALHGFHIACAIAQAIHIQVIPCAGFGTHGRVKALYTT